MNDDLLATSPAVSAVREPLSRLVRQSVRGGRLPTVLIQGGERPVVGNSSWTFPEHLHGLFAERSDEVRDQLFQLWGPGFFDAILDDFRRSCILHYVPEGVSRAG